MKHKITVTDIFKNYNKQRDKICRKIYTTDFENQVSAEEKIHWQTYRD